MASVGSVEAYKPGGAPVGEQVGPVHSFATLGPGQTVVSLFSSPTESGASPVPFVIGVRRNGANTEPSSAEWPSNPIDPAV